MNFLEKKSPSCPFSKSSRKMQLAKKAHRTNFVCMTTMTHRNLKAIPEIIACLPVLLKYDMGSFIKATRCENSSHLK